MSSRGLRRFAARAVPLVAMVLFSMNICGQEEPVEAELARLVIGCRNTPSRSSAVSLEVRKAWVEGNALFADLLVANHSESAIRLPRENVGSRYWHAVLQNSNVRMEVIEGIGLVEVIEVIQADENEVLTVECGLISTVLGLFGDPLEEVVAEKDIENIAPGQTLLLRAVYLAPFSPDPREPKDQVRSFEVTYTGWSSIELWASTAEWLQKPLAEASARQCSLYGGELRSSGHFLTP